MWIILLLLALGAAAVYNLRKKSDATTVADAMRAVGEIVAARRWSRNAPQESPFHAGQGLWVHRLTVRTASGERTVWMQTSARRGSRWCFDDERDQEFRVAPELPAKR